MNTATSAHPCFDSSAKHTAARIHLPVAEKCNIQCHYCNRKYDCVNESRPGVTSAVLQPRQAVEYLSRAMAKEGRISVVGIAGPGDPFATPEPTLETLRLVREKFPSLLLCVASNGLNVAPWLDEIASVGISHFTITVNAVDAAIGSRIYAWARQNRTISRGLAAAQILLERQLEAVRGLKARGITVKINSIVIPGINDQHIPEVARTMASLGADLLNCIPMHPTPETVFEYLPEPSAEALAAIRQSAERYLPQMRHCTRCRADAVGLLGQDRSAEFADTLRRCASGSTRPEQHRPYVAVASWEGMLVNQHLGEAQQFWIFKQVPGGFAHVASRTAPPAGGGADRWQALADTLGDCRSVLVSGVGPSPRQILSDRGIQVVEMSGVIEEGLDAVYNNGNLKALCRRPSSGCGGGCTGTGQGCG